MDTLTTRRKVFISFAQGDRIKADLIAERLHRENIDVWSFTEQTQSGNWHLNEIRALRDSQVAVFLLTPNSATSSACLDEAERVSDPRQQATVPIPIVLGDWDYASSDLWLILGKWNGIIASAGLDETSLGRLVDLVHDRLHTKAISSLSTGQALVSVKDGLRGYLGQQSELNDDELREAAKKFQRKYRGNMVSFLQFAHLDRELISAQLLTSQTAKLHYVSDYLEAYFTQIVAPAYVQCSTRLAQLIKHGETIAITEYSRVIKHAIEYLAINSPQILESLKFLIVSRQGLLLIDDEPSRMRDELVKLGAYPIQIGFREWVEFLLGRYSDPRFKTVDKLLFGVEAFNQKGDVVFPQVIKEIQQLKARRVLSGPLFSTIVIAAGESYKICSDSLEVTKMLADPYYTVIDSTVFDRVVTDSAEYVPAADGSFDLQLEVSSIDAKCDQIRLSLWPKDYPLPIWNLPHRVRASVTLIACDIDETITENGSIPLHTIENFSRLWDVGITTLLVTGRSAGWACALTHYLPFIAGVIAENGSVFVNKRSRNSAPSLMDGWDVTALLGLKRRISICMDEIHQVYPDIVESTDNFTRITDFAFEVSEDIDPAVVAEIATSHNLGHTFSSVHHHIRGSLLDKAAGLVRVAVNELGIPAEEIELRVLTIGDSINDRSLFVRGRFAATVGVRNILPSLDALGDHRPDFVTIGIASEGFNELTSLLCEHRNSVQRK